jgi:NAD(P)-dependent dehydrogenase (short-subunit alcohol dehydrogenase family)
MSNVSVENKVVLVSGSNRGIGKSFAIQALAQGAKKVYATARDVSTLTEIAELQDDRVVALALDVTDQDQVNAVAAAARDVEILINNSGMGTGTAILGTTEEAGMRQELDVNYFGTMKMGRAFAPILEANGGGAMVNILSISGLCSFPFAPGYSASKAAGHSLTQAFRAAMARQNTLVAGVYPGPVDTDMAKRLPFDKASPDSVAINVFEAIANGEEDIFTDPFAVEFARQLREDPKTLEKTTAAGI